MSEDMDLKVQKLMAAIYPTRPERVLGAVVTACYRIDGDAGPISWLGDQADELRCWSQRRRAAVERDRETDQEGSE